MGEKGVKGVKKVLFLVVMVIAMVGLPGFATKVHAAEYPDYLSFTAVGGEVTIWMQESGEPDDYVLEYSKDRQNWTDVTLTDYNTDIVTIPEGETYYFRTDRVRDGIGKLKVIEGSGYFSGWIFMMTGPGKVEAAGNIMSLLDPTCEKTSVGECAFYSLFRWCDKLLTAPKLPAQTLKQWCYDSMFEGCSSLTKAPELPAQTLAGHCYWGMFSGCSGLTKAPELPAQALTGGCYASMFSGCSSLTEAPELPAQTLAWYCYSYMFNGCSSLTTAPELPAQTLVWGCYESMFSGCSKLSSVTVGFTEVEADSAMDDCLENWLKDVSETGTLYCTESLLQYTNEELCLPEGWVKKDVKEQTRQQINNFVTRMYQQCLSRDPDQAGLEGWAGQLENGNMNGAQIAEAFVFSEEMLNKNLSDAESVKALYRSMMGREADEAGLNGWVSQLQGGYLSRSEVTEAFVESTEFTGICSEYEIARGDFAAVGDIERFVTRFYTICLGRTADQKGHWGWVENLRDKKMNGAQIAEAFFFSEEFVNKNVSDEVYIATLYRTILGREADAAGLKGWVEQLQSNQMTRKGILGAFIESNEFTGLCAGYGIERGSL